MTSTRDRRVFADSAASLLSIRSRTARELRSSGMSKRAIAQAAADDAIVAVRRGRYLASDVPADVVRAARVGGRLTCVSALRLLGVFILTSEELHVHIPPHAARLRVPSEGASRHWSPPIGERPSGAGISHPWDLLAHAIVCQSPAAAVASLDSALHWGLILPSELDLVFAAVPRKYRVIRKMLDGRAESGPESLMRLILRRLGLKVEVQVRIDGVGRVDLLVDGWLVIECDSDAHHSGPLAHRVDRRRDLTLAALGYTTLRPMAADIMWHPDRVVAAVRGLLRARRR